MRGTPYVMRRKPLLSPLGLPCNAPPWGTLAAVMPIPARSGGKCRSGQLRACTSSAADWLGHAYLGWFIDHGHRADLHRRNSRSHAPSIRHGDGTGVVACGSTCFRDGNADDLSFADRRAPIRGDRSGRARKNPRSQAGRLSDRVRFAVSTSGLALTLLCCLVNALRVNVDFKFPSTRLTREVKATGKHKCVFGGQSSSTWAIPLWGTNLFSKSGVPPRVSMH